jgi:hypothetical protein
MNAKKLNRTLYKIANRWRWPLYLLAILIIVIPTVIVFATDNGFSSFYSKVLINIALGLIIVGKILGTFKKTMEDGFTPSSSIGSIIGLLLVFIWNILK